MFQYEKYLIRWSLPFSNRVYVVGNVIDSCVAKFFESFRIHFYILFRISESEYFSERLLCGIDSVTNVGRQ